MSDRSLEEKDIFVTTPPRQPKVEIVSHIAGQSGILMPQVFADLKEALAAIQQGEEIIVRSEHPEEYNGAAGLLVSYSIDTAVIQEAKQKPEWPRRHSIFSQLPTINQSGFEQGLKDLSAKGIAHYCQLTGRDVDSFMRGISYSYWRKIEGLNRSIVADSAIAGRYHIFTTCGDTNGRLLSKYTLVDDNNITVYRTLDYDCRKEEVSPEAAKDAREAIAFYETIRNTSGLDTRHCYLVEFQTSVENTNYLLQAHRTRDAIMSEWILDRPLEQDEIEAEFVRGCTHENGMEATFMVYKKPHTKKLEESENIAGCDLNNYHVQIELMNREKGRVITVIPETLSEFICGINSNHTKKSQFFNPPVSLCVPLNKLPKESGGKVKVVSDGRKAYVKFL